MHHLRVLIPVSLLLLGGAALPARAQSAAQDEKSNPKGRQPRTASASAPQPQADAPQPQRKSRADAPQPRGNAMQPQDRAPQPQADAPQPRTRSMKRHAPAPGRDANPEPPRQPPPDRQASSPARPPGRAPAVRPADAPAPTQQVRQWEQGKHWQRGNGWKGSQDWHSSRARNWKDEHRDWAQRGGYGGYRIPVVYFQTYYGPTNYFRMESQPVMYMGYPRFVYGGYNFIIVDPYPEYWVENWYDTEDVYIVYDDGYYLYNRSNPGVALSISVNF